MLYHYDRTSYKWSDLTHDLIFDLFRSIQSDTELIIGNESDFEEDNNTFILVLQFLLVHYTINYKYNYNYTCFYINVNKIQIDSLELFTENNSVTNNGIFIIVPNFQVVYSNYNGN